MTFFITNLRLTFQNKRKETQQSDLGSRRRGVIETLVKAGIALRSFCGDNYPSYVKSIEIEVKYAEFFLLVKMLYYRNKMKNVKLKNLPEGVFREILKY